MIQRFIAVLILFGSCSIASSGQTRTTKSPSPAELALAGKTTEAVRAARRIPSGASDALKTLCERVDSQITERQFAEAKATLAVAERFLNAYQKTDKTKPFPSDGLKGRTLRLQGILHSEQKEFDKALSVLREALEVGRRVKDPTLEAGIHNNIGYALMSSGNHDEAVKEFTTSRDIAEGQKDDLRAASYNFNLGLSLYELRKWEGALDAFKRAAAQSDTASRPILTARATLYQGLALHSISEVSPEAMKYFVNAQKMFEKLGDQRNSARCFFQMGEHAAYSQDPSRATFYGEQAVAGFSAINDKQWLYRCYDFLAQMYERSGNKVKAAEYKKKAQELSPGKGIR